MGAVPRQVGEKYSKKNTWPSAIYELPRMYRLALNDLELDKFGVTGKPSLAQLRESTRFDGPRGEKAKKAFAFVKHVLLKLVRRAASDPSRAVDNEDYVESKCKEIDSTRPHHYARRIQHDFVSLAGYLEFFDIDKASERARNPEIQRKNLEESFERESTKEWINTVIKNYKKSGGGKDDEDGSLPRLTMDQLLELPYHSEDPDVTTLQTVAVQLKLKVDTEESELREKIAEKLGHLAPEK